MHDDLLETAMFLATLDKRKPKQANLRRSISTTYYALFHYLIDCTCRSIIGSQHADAPFRSVISRAFQHNEMNGCCKSFQNGSGGLPVSVRTALPSLIVEPFTVKIARTFCELQQLRADADYNLSARFRKDEVVGLIHQAQFSMTSFDDLPLDNSKRLFLSCLWSWDRIKGR